MSDARPSPDPATWRLEERDTPFRPVLWFSGCGGLMTSHGPPWVEAKGN